MSWTYKGETINEIKDFPPNTLHWMGKHMKGCLKRVKSAFKVAKRVSTDLSMKESSRMICSTDRESSFMQTDSQAMKANG